MRKVTGAASSLRPPFTTRHPWKWVLVPMAFLALVVLYRNDPSEGGFPVCPFHGTTGLLCPGCGAQRAMHHLLHGRVSAAWTHNALLVIAIPLLGLHWGAYRIRALTGSVANKRVIGAWVIVILVWWVMRNTAVMTGFAQ